MRINRIYQIIFLFFLLVPAFVLGQSATVEGVVIDENNKVVDLANVAIIGQRGGTTTNKQGYFSLKVPA